MNHFGLYFCVVIVISDVQNTDIVCVNLIQTSRLIFTRVLTVTRTLTSPRHFFPLVGTNSKFSLD